LLAKQTEQLEQMEEEIKRLERESAEVQNQLEESDEESSECKHISVKFRILSNATYSTDRINNCGS